MNVLITGGTRGLGAATAAAFRRVGAEVLTVSRRAQDAGRKPGGGAEAPAPHVFLADLRDPSAPAVIMAAARALWPRLDVLVNNAAVGGPVGMVADNEWGAWEETIRVNLLAPVDLCRLAIGWMRETGGGRIVNLSGGGATGPRPGFSAYATAKCGLVRFTETVAGEVADLGIRVNCVAPGVMNTDLLREQTGAAFAAAQDSREVAAELIVYLGSEESAGITGKLISAVWDPWRTLHERAAELAGSDVYTLRRVTPVV